MRTPTEMPTAAPGPAGPPPPTARRRLGVRLRNYFLTGVIVTAPIGLTAYLTWLVVHGIDSYVTPLVPARYNPETYLTFSIPGFGLLVVLAFITFVGFVTANFVGRRLIMVGEKLVDRMPVVRSVYNALKQILETVIKQSATSFNKVVLVEYPRHGVWALAFVTADTTGEIRRTIGDDLVSVFLPTTPNPTSGFLLFVPVRDVIFLDMTVEEAAKMVISAGVVVPTDRAALRPRQADAARIPEPVDPG